MTYLSTFPEIFTYEMMYSMLKGLGVENVSDTIRSLDGYVYKTRGKYYIAPNIRS